MPGTKRLGGAEKALNEGNKYVERRGVGPWGKITEADRVAIQVLNEERLRQKEALAVKKEERDTELTRAKSVIAQHSARYAMLGQNAGAFLNFYVKRKLDKENFKGAGAAANEDLYEIVLGENIAILITSVTDFTSTGQASMRLNKSGQNRVKMNDGFEKSVQVYRESTADQNPEYIKLAGLIREAESTIRSIGKAINEELKRNEALEYATVQLRGKIRLPQLFVSKDLKQRGFRAVVIQTKQKELIDCMRRGDALKILRIIKKSSVYSIRKKDEQKEWLGPKDKREVDNLLGRLNGNTWDLKVTLRSPGFKFQRENDTSIYRPQSTHGSAYHNVEVIRLLPQTTQLLKFERGKVSMKRLRSDGVSTKHPDNDGFIVNVGMEGGQICFYESHSFVMRRVSSTQSERVTAPDLIISDYFRGIEKDVGKFNQRIDLGELNDQAVLTKIKSMDRDIRNKVTKEYMMRY